MPTAGPIQQHQHGLVWDRLCGLVELAMGSLCPESSSHWVASNSESSLVFSQWPITNWAPAMNSGLDTALAGPLSLGASTDTPAPVSCVTLGLSFWPLPRPSPQGSVDPLPICLIYLLLTVAAQSCKSLLIRSDVSRSETPSFSLAIHLPRLPTPSHPVCLTDDFLP